MKTLDIYIDLLFLKKFFESEPTDKKTIPYRNWLDFYFFLRSTHICLFNAKDGKLIDKNDFIRQFEMFADEKQRNDFFAPLQLNVENYAVSKSYQYNQNIKNPHTIFFIEFEKEVTESLEKSFGYLFVNSKNYMQKWKLLNPRNHQSFITISNKGDIKNWNDFEYLKHSANSLIIVDRYIFGGNYAHNLAEMLLHLFPSLANSAENTTCFDITLIIGNKINNNNVDLKDNKDLVENVKKVFKKHFPKCELTVVQLLKRSRDNRNQEKREDIPLTHDRRIISNYFYFSSGDSITYESSPNDMLANTDFHIYSIFDSKTFETVQTRLAEFKYQIDNKTHANNYIGTKQNRLLN
jgi:hypothetical protein